MHTLLMQTLVVGMLVQQQTLTQCLDVLHLFNQDIGNWDVSSVINFDWLVTNAESFNQDIRGWDVSSGKNFRGFFSKRHRWNQGSFNEDISFEYESATSSEEDPDFLGDEEWSWEEVMFWGQPLMIEMAGL